MNPYELRFEIFKQAYTLVQDRYISKYNFTDDWNQSPKTAGMMEYPFYPSYEEVEEMANKINNFVSSK